ncbi:short-chain collagen C4-like [Saccostrea cucullata]|uniref:short-chain collagen C4-like n=1 Tax=Saccostrea cuccullata TaxID=36930 RepID=UPI002ED31146
MSQEKTLKDLTKEAEEWKAITQDNKNKNVPVSKLYVQSIINETTEVHAQRLADALNKLKSLERKLKLYRKENTDLWRNKIEGGTPTYVRWGRSTCNNGSKLLYVGQAGGTFYNSKGGAANPLCLTYDVLWGYRTKSPHSARLHGAEYETNFWGPNFDDTDVPCAVCQLKISTHVLMIPGRNKCLKGWTEEYHGYLSSETHSGDRSRGFYTCVDESPEQIKGGSGNANGFLFYDVVAKCGSLKCPPYINNKPITCVVCSQ